MRIGGFLLLSLYYELPANGCGIAKAARRARTIKLQRGGKKHEHC
jgi:hypothetical protein